MTSTASPGVERALDVLRFIADHEPCRFTASQLSELLNLNRGSCQSLLLAFEVHGCVSRSPRGTYGLGQTLRYWSEKVVPGGFGAAHRTAAMEQFAIRHSCRIGLAALVIASMCSPPPARTAADRSGRSIRTRPGMPPGWPSNRRDM